MKKRHALIIALFISTISKANTYYVNDLSLAGDVFTIAAGNNSNPGTAALPFATLAKALTVATISDTIFIDAGIYSDKNQTIIQSNLTIIGAGSSKTNFNNNFASANTNYLLKINANGVKVTGLMAIKYNNTVTAEGKVITVSGASGVVLKDIVLTNNYGSGGGNGALYIAANSSVSVSGGSYSCNPNTGSTNDYGGGIDIVGTGSIVTIDSASISNNGKTAFEGGGIYISGNNTTVVTITNCSVSNNSAMNGGAVYSSLLSGLSTSTPGPLVTIRNSCFSNNFSQDLSAFSYGGAVTIFSGTAVIKNCSFTSNTGGKGGAIALNSIDGIINLTVDSCSFSGNTTTQGNSGYDLYARVGFSHTVTVAGNQNTFSAAASSVVNGNTATITLANSGNPGTTGTSGSVTLSNTTPPNWVTATACPTTVGSCVCTTPVIFTQAKPDTICSGTLYSTLLTANTPPVYTSLTWTSSAVSGITGHSTNGSGDINETLTNSTGNPLTVNYTITPNYNSLCSGSSVNYAVVVIPGTTVTSPNTTTVCSGIALNFPLTSNPSGSFNWIASNNTNTNGESLTQQSGNAVTDLIINNSSQAQTVTYLVTPIGAGGTCSIASQTLSVTVNPAPAVTSPFADSVCSGVPFSFPITSSLNSSFTWQATDNTNTSGESLSTQTTSTINNTITNLTGTPQVVSYNVTPVSVSGNCTGNPSLINISVFPIPNLTIANADTLTCANQQVTLHASSLTAGVTYNWGGGNVSPAKTITAAGNYSVTVTEPGAGCTTSASTSVAQNTTPPGVTISVPSNLTCSVTTVLLSASSNVTGAAYAWSNGSNTANTSVNASGNYTVTVTDPSNGCTASASTAVGQATGVPDVSIATPNTLTCSVNSVVLSASSGTQGVTYNWGNGITTNTNTVTAPGSYSVTVTNPSNGCSAAASTTVNQNISAPTVNLTQAAPLTCSLTGSIINATTSASSVTYAWSNTIITAADTIHNPGTYTVTVTDLTNGCTSSASVSVSQNIATPDVSIAPPATLNCINSSVNLTAHSNTTGILYDWGNGINTASLQASNSGSYTVTATDPANGCTASATASVSQNIAAPTVVIATPDTLTCSATSVTITAYTGVTGAGYLWNGGTTGASNVVTAAGTYSVTAIDPSNGCTASASTSVVSNASLSINTTAINTTCGNDNGSAAVVVTSGAALNYNWSNGAQTSAIQNLSAGTYSVTVNGNAGCSATASVVINPSGNTPVTITATQTVFCSGDSTQVCAPSGYAGYLWNNGSSDSCIYTKLAGNYYVTVTDNGNCTAVSNHLAISVHPQPPVSISVNGDTLVAYNSLTYQWILNGVPIAGATSGMYIANQPGSYQVLVSDGTGCTALSIPVIVNITGIKSVKAEEFFVVYPNPAGQIANISISNEMLGCELHIFDVIGRQLEAIQINAEFTSINTVFFPNGVYFFTINKNGKSITQKLAVNN